MKKELTLLLIASFLTINLGCDLIDPPSAQVTLEKEIPETKLINEYTEETELYFCPRQDCLTPTIQFLNSSNQSIHCALYDLSEESIIETLNEKSKSLDVKLVVDERYKEDLLQYEFIRYDTSSQYSHNKFCIIDNKKIFTGSMNPTYNGLNKNNNNLILINSKNLANNFETEFQELWNGKFGKGQTNTQTHFTINNILYEQYFCPEDNCANIIQKQIMSANESIHFMTFSFTHGGIATDLAYQHQKGITIKGIYEKTQAGSQYSTFKILEYQGLDIKKDTNPKAMHHKVFIIDNQTVITGSMNPSKSGNEKNDENILIIHDKKITDLFLEEFNYIWNLED
ncbi:phospholipase D-like domain-containing protein [Nanoarchaeota archaeon]